MKICWDNLEKLKYNQKTKNLYYKNTIYIYKDACKTCKEPFLAPKHHHSKNDYCCHKCVPARWGKDNPRYGKHCTEEHKRKISESEKGKMVSEKTRQKLSKTRLKYIKENPELAYEQSAKSGKKLKGKKQSKEVVDAVKEKWKDPEYKAKKLKQMMKHMKPNRPENKIIKICEKFGLPYDFIGNGALIIGGFNPDFVNTGDKKLIIEVFGGYWHNRVGWTTRDRHRLKTFSDNGYKTLVLWENQLVSRKGVPSIYSEEQIRDIILDEDNYKS